MSKISASIMVHLESLLFGVNALWVGGLTELPLRIVARVVGVAFAVLVQRPLAVEQNDVLGLRAVLHHQTGDAAVCRA